MKIIFYSIAFSCLFIACDPGFHEEMNIHNKSGKLLSFYMQFSNYSLYDSSQIVNNNRDLLFSFGNQGDSMRWVRTDIAHGENLIIHGESGIGHIRFDDSQSAYDVLKNSYDTILIENVVVNKELMNFDIWHQKVEHQKFSSSAYFNLNIVRGDVK